MLKKWVLSSLLLLVLAGAGFTAFALENEPAAVCFMACIEVCHNCVPDIQGCAALCGHILP